LRLTSKKTPISITVSDEDLALIDVEAQASGLSRSAYLVRLGVEGGAGARVDVRRALERASKQAAKLAATLGETLRKMAGE